MGLGQYTMIPNAAGGIIDDAYLYRFFEDEYLLVVNAANREKDWNHLESERARFPQTGMVDRTFEVAMLSLQGPLAKEILSGIIEGELPEPMRNELSVVEIDGARVLVARTGYTGEPLCFELFIERDAAVQLWHLLTDRGAVPVGLGARDTLRLEAGLPLYGHELGLDPAGKEIPTFASDLSRFAVSFSPLKGEFIGREPLLAQFHALKRILDQDFADITALPQRVLLLELSGKGITRPGDKVFHGDRARRLRDQRHDGALLGSEGEGRRFPLHRHEPEARHRHGAGVQHPVGRRRGRGGDPRAPHDGDHRALFPARRGAAVRAFHRAHAASGGGGIGDTQAEPVQKVRDLLDDAIANTRWRQQDCINLIPSEMSLSPAVKLLSVMDPVGRYAEHKQVKALDEAEVFYYQGTDFIWEVEEALKSEMSAYLGCPSIEARLVSGQMANMTVFSAMVDYLNRADRKSEPRRMRMVMNNHIIKGGHLSAQPMGALKDYVARDPRTEAAGGGQFPGVAGQSRTRSIRRRPACAARGAPPGTRHSRQEHGAAPRAGGRAARVHRRARPRLRADVRHGARAGTGRTAFPGAVQGRRRHRHRLDPQDLLRHAARHHRLALHRGRHALPALGGGRAPRLPGRGQQPPPRHAAGPADGGLRDERLQGQPTSRR